MRKFIPLLALLLVACPGLQPALIGQSIGNICDRHDEYVNADTSLNPETKTAYLDETKLLRQIVAEAGDSVSPDAIEALSISISIRHDAYVENDTSLSTYEHDAYLSETNLLRAVIQNAK